MTLTRALFRCAVALFAAFAFASALAAPPKKVTSGEGVTEYQLDNGLRVLLVPDASIDTFMVHITYLVGSRHEGYGEKGMAHLLEHMLFKGTARHANPKEALAKRGARYNGTTSYDRTNYYETLSASRDNLDWTLGLEADRMVNALVRQQDLVSEMTVVRNEFESGENSSGRVLHQRMMQLAFPWHNYGNSVIGSRSDIENVPIERLRDFYRRYYQPDNAILQIGGKFDDKTALALVEKHFGSIPRPTRILPRLYTAEPTQDGERSVVLRRAGDTQLVSAMYRIPSGGHPDYPAVDILTQVMSTQPTGRLHRALVQKSLATAIWGNESALHDPGVMYFGASLSKSQPLEPARAALLETLESVAREPVTAEEVNRAKTAMLNDFEKIQIDTLALVPTLSEFIATGDWRLFFLYRDRVRKVTPADVQRMATAYILPANRVLGSFVPTEQPARAEIPPTPDLLAALAGYTGGKSPEAGEVFDPSPANIESRTVRRTLPNGIRVALLPKKTRGGNVVAKFTLHWGDESSLTNRITACSLAGGMLMRGTQKRSRAELQEAFQKLNAIVSVDGGGSQIDTQRPQFADTLRLVAEVLREPSFTDSEFVEMKQAAITSVEAQRSDPGALAAERLSRHLSQYPKGHWLYPLAIEERIAALKQTTLDEVRLCYSGFFGATRAEFVAVGDFDPEAVMKQVEELFGSWKSPVPYQRIQGRHFEVPGVNTEIRTPDKANAVLRIGANLKLRDDHPDFPALILGNYLLGGTGTARLGARVREKEGLSYGVYSSFSASQLDEVASLGVSAIYAPQNKKKVETAVREEIARVLSDGFTAEEVSAGKNAILEARRNARTQDRDLVGRMALYLFVGRTFSWDIDFEKRIAALTPTEIRDALRRHIDPAQFAVMKAGDFKE